MEQFVIARDKAIKYLKLADHIATVTYPLIKDPKLLISALNNIFLSLTNSMGAILYYEQLYKRVPLFTDDFESKFRLIKTHADRILFSRHYLTFIMDIKDLVVTHRKSSMAFSRKDKFIMYSDPTNIKSIGAREIIVYIEKTRNICRLMNTITNNARLLRNS